ncbi:hypothetical protein ACQ5SP_01955 [Rhodovulum sp. YNF3179]|uniref:hypothetical protein n=1 Tax=Rhodovulum sp. YNF3179 TaxID=3425127 RepID=UPI003D3416C5
MASLEETMGKILSAIAVFAFLAVAGPSVAQGYSEPATSENLHLVATDSDQVATRVVMLDKRRRGNLMDFEIRVEFDNVPQGKDYQFFIYDAGMQRDGLPPAPVPNASHRFKPDSRGHLEFSFVLDGFSKGEWVQCRLISSDRSVEKALRFTPFR